MSDFINECVGIDLPKKLVYDVLEGWGNCAPSDLNLKLANILDYLSEKYELVCLTDWFEEPQINRLKIAGIYKYLNAYMVLKIQEGNHLKKLLKEQWISFYQKNVL